MSSVGAVTDGWCNYVLDVSFTATLSWCLEPPFPSPFPPLPQLDLALLQGGTAALQIYVGLEFAEVFCVNRRASSVSGKISSWI